MPDVQFIVQSHTSQQFIVQSNAWPTVYCTGSCLAYILLYRIVSGLQFIVQGNTGPEFFCIIPAINSCYFPVTNGFSNGSSEFCEVRTESVYIGAIH